MLSIGAVGTNRVPKDKPHTGLRLFIWIQVRLHIFWLILPIHLRALDCPYHRKHGYNS